MKTIKTALILSSLLLLASGIAASQPLAIINVTVIDVSDGIANPNMTVVVTGDRITALGSVDEIETPADARLIDGTGKFLIPGLWDMHVHFVSETLRLYIANGITGVREMGMSSQSIDKNDDLRRRIAEGEVIGPRYVVGVTINDRPGWNVVGAATAEAGRTAVDSLRRAGADFIKVYGGLSRETYFAISAEARRQGIPFAGHVPDSVTVEEAARSGQRSFEHLITYLLLPCSSRSTDLRVALDELDRLPRSSGQSGSWWAKVRSTMMLAVESYDEDRCHKAVRGLAAHGGWQTPTLMAGMRWPGVHNDSVVQDSRLAYLPTSVELEWKEKRSTYVAAISESDQREFHKLLLRLVSVLHSENIGLLAGTDAAGASFSYPGFSLHDELNHLVNAGLSPVEALRTATMEPARYFGMDDSIGVIEEGMLADLVLIDANPLEDITNTQKIHAVMANGRYFDRQALDRMLEEVERAAKRTEDK